MQKIFKTCMQDYFSRKVWDTVEEKKWKFNVFDIVIILVVLGLAFVAYQLTRHTKNVDTVSQTYQVELQECPEGLSKNVIVGTKIADSVKNYEMGTITKVDVSPSLKLGENRIDGGYNESVVEGAEDIVLTVEAQVANSDTELRVASGYVIKAGKEAMVRGSGFAGKGYVITVNR